MIFKEPNVRTYSPIEHCEMPREVISSEDYKDLIFECRVITLALGMLRQYPHSTITDVVAHARKSIKK
jgi:hypothetical protein